MFYHKKCNKKIGVKIDHMIGLLGDVYINENHKLFVGEIVMILKHNSYETIFFCPFCNEEIGIEDILAGCNYCNKLFDINEMKYIVHNGGIYCQEHTEEFFSDREKISLSEIIKKIYIGEQNV